jgi:exonuclease III
MMRFLSHIEKIRKSARKLFFVVILNTAHEEIDLARPKENEETPVSS